MITIPRLFIATAGLFLLCIARPAGAFSSEDNFDGVGSFLTTWGTENFFNVAPVACFSDSSTVEVLNRGIIPMKDLVVGDRVRTGKTRYQPIYIFGHKEEAGAEHEFLQIQTDTVDNKQPLEITPDHLVFAVNEKTGAQEAVRADAIKVGDMLFAATGSSIRGVSVTQISTIQKQGAYMPLTADGKIVVDGIMASAYLSIEDKGQNIHLLRSYFGILSEQTIFHWWLSPLRMVCIGVSGACSAPEDLADDQGILTWLLIGRYILMFGEKQNMYVQIFAMALPAFVLFGSLNLVEFAFGAALAPILILLMIAYLTLSRRANRGHVDSGKKQS